jgi:MYXO-CTERM domain-containing protein
VVVNTEGNSMKTYSRLTLAFLLMILVVPQVDADEPAALLLALLGLALLPRRRRR